MLIGGSSFSRPPQHTTNWTTFEVRPRDADTRQDGGRRDVGDGDRSDERHECERRATRARVDRHEH
jgi:hypothetical protein